MMNYLYFNGERQIIQAFKEMHPHTFWRAIGTVEKNFLLWKSLLLINENSSDDTIAKACDDIDFLVKLLKNESVQPMDETDDGCPKGTSMSDNYTVEFN